MKGTVWKCSCAAMCCFMAKVSKVKQLHHVIILSPRGEKKSTRSDRLSLLFKKCTPSNVWCFLYCLYIIIPLPKKTCSFLCFLNLSKSNLKAKCFSFSSKLSAEENNFLFPHLLPFLDRLWSTSHIQKSIENPKWNYTIQNTQVPFAFSSLYPEDTFLVGKSGA